MNDQIVEESAKVGQASKATVKATEYRSARPTYQEPYAASLKAETVEPRVEPRVVATTAVVAPEADTSAGKGSDPIDQVGHTVAGAVEHDPALDPSLPAGSQVSPKGDQQVRAQTPEEVKAQMGR